MSTHRIRSLNRRQSGFTLAEILVTTAIFAIIMIAALAVYDRSNRVFKTSTEAADMQQSTRVGFDKLVSDLRMAGFDYSRGGVPQATGQWAQPDEQIEYAGPTAVIFRANFNYNTAAAQGHGLEPAYTPVNVNGGPIFPYVTTSDDEIVAYVLRSANAAANTGAISFYVDDYRPRAGFPANLTPAPAGTNPSRPERAVTINGIDITNGNPPYTLYRVSVTDIHNGSLGTPVAENIRSLNFQYYSDATGTALLKDAAGNDITVTKNAGGSPTNPATALTGAIGGDGQYDPANANTPNVDDRTARGLIQSVRVSLVGMNATPDLQGYTHPTETITSISSYRQYSLSSLVVPRNLGKTGFPEPSYNVPGPVTITGACIGHCGAPVLYWTPPSVGGPVVQYRVEWDTVDQGGAYSQGFNISDPTAVSVVISDDGTSDVSQTRYYRVFALNDNGASLESNHYPAVAQNKTKPDHITSISATGGPQQITLNLVAPTDNVAPNNILACNGTGGNTSGTTIPPQENLKFKIYRGLQPDFDPNDSTGLRDRGVTVLDYTSLLQPVISPGASVTFVDRQTGSPAPPFPPASCTPYYYRIKVADRCVRQANWNVSNNTADSESALFPPITSPAFGPVQATGGYTPVPPNLNIDTSTPNATGCPDPQIVGSTNCRITLNWGKVANNTNGDAMTVDVYRLTRAFRVQALGGSYVTDPAFGTLGQLSINCSTGAAPATGAPAYPPGCSTGTFSQSPNTPKFVDSPPATNVSSQALEYQYQIQALGCLGAVTNPPASTDPYSAYSNAVTYPGCATNPAIVEAGASNPLASGDAPGQAWVFNAGDTITVTPANPAVIANVKFDTTMWPQGTAVPGLSPPAIPFPGPYRFTWSDQIDGQIYQVKITLTTNSVPPCQEIHVKYVQDQQGAPCAFPNQSSPPAPSLAIPSGNGANVLDTLTQTFTIPNNGTDPMQLASRNLQLTWALPAGDANHGDLKLTSLTWTVGTNTTTNNLTTPAGLASPPPTVTNVTAPSNVVNVPPGSSLTLQIRWQYLKSDDCIGNNCTGANPPQPALELTTSPLQKLCMDYRIVSEPGVTKHCNVVGQSGSTNNPNSCD